MKIKENETVPNSEVFVLENGEPVKKNIENILKNKKSVIFGLPGAYTSVCSAKHLPGYVNNTEKYKQKGIDQIICISVNDPFVMNAWAKQHEIENVKMIPDGSGEFTRDMDMIVFKPAQNFGLRSWRYAMIVNDMEIEQMIVELGKNQQGLDDDPYEETKPENILSKL